MRMRKNEITGIQVSLPSFIFKDVKNQIQLYICINVNQSIQGSQNSGENLFMVQPTINTERREPSYSPLELPMNVCTRQGRG